MDKAAAWFSGLAFMAGAVVLVPPDADDWQTAVILFVVSFLMALMALKGSRNG
jgi:membrane protein implicated in regulation of membrane protease activity